MKLGVFFLFLWVLLWRSDLRCYKESAERISPVFFPHIFQKVVVQNREFRAKKWTNRIVRLGWLSDELTLGRGDKRAS